MSDHPACMSCRFCGSIPNPDKGLQFVCRRHPPKVFATAVQMAAQIGWASTVLLPVVQNTDWCGEYQPSPVEKRLQQ